MTIEFNLKDNETILLSPFKKESDGNKVQFDLVDENQQIWIVLEKIDQSLKVITISDDIIDSDEVIEIKLDDLYLNILEIEKSGTDSFNENNSFETNPYDPEKIKVRSDKIPITLISQMIDSGDIDMNPDFQRNLVWDNLQKSRLIESILLRIPLPMFYFAEDKDGKLTVVDGLQRISTIKDFMDNKFPLKKLQYLDNSCGGKYYSPDGKKEGIDSKYFRWFNLTTLSANIIDPTSPYKVKYDIFRRINTGGRPLNNQEVRNCLTGIGLREILKEMAGLPEFISATDNSIKAKRMEDQEVALRFLHFYSLLEKDDNIYSYSGYMDTSLDEFTEHNIKTPKLELEKYVLLFSNAMRNAEYLIGRKYAFRKITPRDLSPNSNKQLINKALFVCTSILLAKYDHILIREFNEEFSLLNVLANKIDEDEILFDFLSYGTNGRNNLMYTFDILMDLFDNHIKY